MLKMRFRSVYLVPALGIILALSLLLRFPIASHAQANPCDLNAVVESVGEHNLTDDTTPQIILLQERHDLVTAQVEGALMIHRLIEDCGFRVVGMEAAFPDTSFDTTWFSEALEETIQPHIAVSMLGEGEINQGEFGALVYPSLFPDYTIVGIEDQELYDYEPDFGDSGGLETAMIYTALIQLGDADLTTALEMLDQSPDSETDPDAFSQWYDEFTEFIFTNSTNADIRDWHETNRVQDGCVTVSIEADIANIDAGVTIVEALQSQTEELLGIDLDENLTDTQAEREFNVIAHDRSVVMVDEILAQFERNDGAPIVAVIGAAHTEWMDNALKEAGYSTAVLSPLSYCDDTQGVPLSYDAYTRKLDAKSIDLPGLLGSILSGTRKPPIVLAQSWLQVKTALYGVAALVTDALFQDPNMTLEEILGGVPLLPGVSVDMDSLHAVNDVPNRWVFRVALNIEHIPVNEIFVGVGTTDLNEPGNYNSTTSVDIEQLLLQELEQLRSDGLQESVDESDPQTLLTQVAPGMNAIFSTSEENVISAISNV